ncbi:MAG: glycosyltransferase family 39 protein [Patescibacteria group bacterium]|nr:glycosyltransferase family 39 protein [Patescibacteria group bacterium]
MKKYSFLILFLILILGFALRYYRINSPLADWHSWRQADTASVTRIYVEEGINLLYPKYYDISTIQSGIFNPEGYRFVEFPIYNLFHAYLVKLFPQYGLEYLGRLLSIFFGLISTICLFIIGKKFWGDIGGLLSAVFYAFIPFNVYFTRVILPEPLSVCLGLISLCILLSYLDNKKEIYLYLGSFVLSLAILVKPFVVFYVLPIVFLIFKNEGIKKVFLQKKYHFASFITLTPFALWRLWVSQFPEGIPFFWWMFNGGDIRFKPSFWRWIFAERIGSLILGSWGLIVLGFGMLRKNNYTPLFPLIFLVSSFLYLTIFAQVNVQHDYYQIFIVPALCLVLTQGVLSMWYQKEWDVLVTRFVLLFSLFVMFVAPMSQVKGMFNINHPEIIWAGEAVDRLVPKDALVVAPYNGDTAFLYQTKRRGWPFIDRPIDEIVNLGADFFVSVDLAHPQTREIMQKYEIVEKTDSYVIVDFSKPKI